MLTTKRTLFIILFLFTSSSFAQKALPDCSSLTMGIELDANYDGTNDSFIDRHKEIGSIKNSPADLEIRCYTIPSLTNGGHVMIIKCENNQISARSIKYWFNPDKPAGKRKINKIEIKNLEPVQSWGVFFDSLQSLTFFTLPTMEEVRPKMKKYMTLDDGKVVEVRSQILDGVDYRYEIKIGLKIRTFSYHSPLAWYRTYDTVDELKKAGEIRNHFVSNLVEANTK
jgi:hypothetical protein